MFDGDQFSSPTSTSTGLTSCPRGSMSRPCNVDTDGMNSSELRQVLESFKQLKKKLQHEVRDLRATQAAEIENCHERIQRINEEQAGQFFKDFGNGIHFSRRLEACTKTMKEQIAQAENELKIFRSRADDDVDACMQELLHREHELMLIELELDRPVDEYVDFRRLSGATKAALQREESRRVGVLQQMDCLDVIGGAVDAADFDTDFALLVDGNEQFVAQQQQLLEQELISHADTAALALESQLQEALVRQAVEAEKRGAEIDKALDLACDRFLATAKDASRKFTAVHETEKKKKLKAMAMRAGSAGTRGVVNSNSNNNFAVSGGASVRHITRLPLMSHVGRTNATSHDTSKSSSGKAAALPWKIELTAQYADHFEHEIQCRAAEQRLDALFLQRLHQAKADPSAQAGVDEQYVQGVLRSLAQLYDENNDLQLSSFRMS